MSRTPLTIRSPQQLLDRVPRNRWTTTAAPLAVPVVLLLALPVFGVSQPDALARAIPFVLTALAVALPARAGLINVGGEGQLLMGAAAAGAWAFIVKDALPLAVMLPAMCVVGVAGGLLWSSIAATLRVAANVNETISTLLLNYVASLLLAFLVHDALKDPESFGFAYGPKLDESAQMPLLGDGPVHLGLVVALVAVVAVWLLIERSRWGFRAKVVGGNPEAARRGGIHVGRTVMVALLLGGGIAGIAGSIELSGTELRLRSDIATGFGYIGFLASWMVRHRTAWIPSSALLLAAIAVAGDNLQIDAGLPAASVYVLMALIVLAVLARKSRPAEAADAAPAPVPPAGISGGPAAEGAPA